MIIEEGTPYNKNIAERIIIEKSEPLLSSRGIPVKVIGIVGTGASGTTDAQMLFSASESAFHYGDIDKSEITKYIDAVKKQNRNAVFVCKRVVGSGAVAASISISAGSATTWTITLLEKGAFGNDASVEVIAGNIENTVTLKIIYKGVEYQVQNVDNTSGSAYFVTDNWTVDFCTVSKTGVATTLPSVAGHAHFTSGADGSAPADGDYVTGLDDLLNWAAVKIVVFPGVATSTKRTGLIAHCNAIYGRIAVMSPVTQTNVAAVIAEAKTAGHQESRVMTAYGKWKYFNRITNSYDLLDHCWAVGVISKYQVGTSALWKDISGEFSTVLTYQNMSDLADHNIVFPRNLSGKYVMGDACLETRDPYKKSYEYRTALDEIEFQLDEAFARIIGYTKGLEDTVDFAERIIFSVMQPLLTNDVLQGFKTDFSMNTEQTRAQGKIFCNIILYKVLEIRNAEISITRTDSLTTFNEKVV